MDALKKINKEFDLLQNIFSRKQVTSQLHENKHSDRNRYIDILTYCTTRVKLEYGVNYQ